MQNITITEKPAQSWQAWYTICLLSIAHTFSAIDRVSLSLVTDDIKRDLLVSDTQYSLLTGLAFAAIYTIAAIPLARISDRYGRKWIVVGGVFLWGAMTAACGFAGSFLILFLFRMGVGLGEATLTANAYAYVPEVFPRKNQAKAMSLFIIGGAIGYGGSLLFGGLLLGAFQHHAPPLSFLPSDPWRLLLVTFGVATLILVGPLMAILNSKAPADPSQKGHIKSTDVFGYFISNWRALMGLMVGAPMLNIVAVALLVWLPPFFIRVHKWETAQAGISIGATLIVVSVATAIVAGWIATKYSGPNRAQSIMRFLALAGIAAAPLLGVGVLAGNAVAALTLLSIAYGLVAFVSTLAPLAFQDSIPPGARAQFSAVFLLVANLAGLAAGPTIVAVATDYIFGAPDMVGAAIGITGVSGLLLAASVILFSNRQLSELCHARLGAD